jgi:hypothetical protein
VNNSDGNIFEFIRNWDNREEMKKDLESQIFTNLMGVIKVLGHIQQSHIYNVTEEEDLLKALE